MQAKTFLGRHYAFAVVMLIFVALLAAAGLRSTPGVLMVPWGAAFGWSRGTISLAAATGIFLFGLTGPFAAAAMQRFGVRATVMTALAMMGLSSAVSLFMTQSWQLVLTWGVVSGIGSGCVTNVLAAVIVNRWFVTRRGLVMGLFAASTSTGTLVFIPALSAIAESGAGSRDFWLLAATFFVCGFTTNGLVGTHMIALCHDHGMEAVAAGGLLAIMGLFDLVGTTASGWLTDRIDPRKLLFAYYGLRGLSLIYLPFANFTFFGLSLFAVFYGLDWIATVPPTLAIANRAFGVQKAPILFGWIAASHQIGAASAAFLAGASRTASGSYLDSFFAAGFVALFAAFLALMIGMKDRSFAQAAV